MYRVKADLQNPTGMEIFEDWPVTINAEDNYGRKAVAYLPNLTISGMNNPVVQVVNESSGKIEYTIRINGDQFRPKVFETGNYTIKIGDPDSGHWEIREHIQASEDKLNLEISF